MFKKFRKSVWEIIVSLLWKSFSAMAVQVAQRQKSGGLGSVPSGYSFSDNSRVLETVLYPAAVLEKKPQRNRTESTRFVFARESICVRLDLPMSIALVLGRGRNAAMMTIVTCSVAASFPSCN